MKKVFKSLAMLAKPVLMLLAALYVCPDVFAEDPMNLLDDTAKSVNNTLRNWVVGIVGACGTFYALGTMRKDRAEGIQILVGTIVVVALAYKFLGNG